VVIGAAAAGAVIAVAAKDGGWGLDQGGVVLIIGAAGGALVGAGVDAMLDRPPSAGLTQRGARGGSRMRARLPKAP
jgi:hypothetical protein